MHGVRSVGFLSQLAGAEANMHAPDPCTTLLPYPTLQSKGAHGRALTTGCGVRAFGFSSSSDSSSELPSSSSLLGGSRPAVAGCAGTHTALLSLRALTATQCLSAALVYNLHL